MPAPPCSHGLPGGRDSADRPPARGEGRTAERDTPHRTARLPGGGTDHRADLRKGGPQAPLPRREEPGSLLGGGGEGGPGRDFPLPRRLAMPGFQARGGSWGVGGKEGRETSLGFDPPQREVSGFRVWKVNVFPLQSALLFQLSAAGTLAPPALNSNTK